MSPFDLALLVRGVRLPPVEKAVLLALALRTGTTGGCWPSQALLAADTGLSLRAVRGGVDKLVERGLVTRTSEYGGADWSSRGNRSTWRSLTYRLVPEAITAASTPARGAGLPRGRQAPGAALEASTPAPGAALALSKEEHPAALEEKAAPGADGTTFRSRIESGTSCQRNRQEVPAKAAPGADKVNQEVTREDQTTPPSPPMGVGASAGVPADEPSSGTRLATVADGAELPGGAYDLPRRSTPGAFGLEAGAWVEGVRSVTGQPLSMPRGGVFTRLVDAIEAHCPPGGDRSAYGRERGAAWAATKPRTVSVFKFIEWLDSGSPAAVAPMARPQRAVQPYDPNSPWLRGGKTA